MTMNAQQRPKPTMRISFSGINAPTSVIGRQRQLLGFFLTVTLLLSGMDDNKWLVSAAASRDFPESSSSSLLGSFASSYQVLPCRPTTSNDNNDNNNNKDNRSRSSNKKRQQPGLTIDNPHAVNIMRSWMIRHKAIRQQQQRVQDYDKLHHTHSAAASAAAASGTRLSLQKPTLEKVEQWFNPSHPSLNHGRGSQNSDMPFRDALRTMLQNPFNHDAVGMTNPLLAVTTTKADDNDNGNEDVRLVSNHDSSAPTSRAAPWWPSLELIPSGNTKNKRQGGRHRRSKEQNDNNNKEWRVLKYQKCSIGTGRECYLKVRDAILDWEFHMDAENMGMMAIPDEDDHLRPKMMSMSLSSSSSSSASQEPQRLPRPYLRQPSFERVSLPPSENQGDDRDGSSSSSTSARDRVRSIWSGPGGRRFVTYGASSPRKFLGLVPFPPFVKIYAVNPVMSVYDVVDQRAPGTTYTSTAYATMKGHWLCGEERVTVAWRDDGSSVDVEVVSLSKPAPGFWTSKIIWPMACKMQSTFFQGQLKALQQIATNCGPQQYQQPNQYPAAGHYPSGIVADANRRRSTMGSDHWSSSFSSSSPAVITGLSSPWLQDCNNLPGTAMLTSSSSSGKTSTPTLSLPALPFPSRLNLPFRRPWQQQQQQRSYEALQLSTFIHPSQ